MRIRYDGQVIHYVHRYMYIVSNLYSKFSLSEPVCPGINIEESSRLCHLVYYSLFLCTLLFTYLLFCYYEKRVEANHSV